MARFFFIGLISIVNLRVTWGSDTEITGFLKQIDVIPDCVPMDAVDFLKVTYDSGVFANKGQELTPTQVKNPPVVDWNGNDNFFYTLMMIHCDTLTMVKSDNIRNRQFHHWLVVNIPGKDINSGNIISEYLSSGPSKGSGLHLYVFLLYKQPSKNEFEEKFIDKHTMKGRSNFSASEFATKYDLGFPLAANYYEAQYDDYVPIVYSQIGF